MQGGRMRGGAHAAHGAPEPPRTDAGGPATLESLDDAALERVLCCAQELGHQDLLRASRVCRRLHRLVCGSETAWERQWAVAYGAPPPPPLQHQHQHHWQQQQMQQGQPAAPAGGYRRLFRERFEREARDARMQRRLAKYRLSSDTALLERELQQLQSRLRRELELKQSAAAQIAQLRHARAARNAQQAWHLSSVRLYHNHVAQAAPVALEAELASLQQQQRVCDLEIRTCQAGIRSRRQRLADVRRRLEALAG